MKVKLGTKEPLFYFDSGSIVGAEPLTVTVKDPLGEEVEASLPLTAVVEVPDLYLSEPVGFTSTGTYTASIAYGDVPVVINTTAVEVGADPVSNFPRAVATPVSIDPRLAGGPAETVQLIVVSGDGEVVSGPTNAPYNAVKALYETEDLTFSGEGIHFLVWTKANLALAQLPFWVEPVQILTPSGAETCVLTVATLEGDNGTPHAAATVVFSQPGGAYVDRTITDVDGRATINLDPGKYVASLIKDGSVYSTNNFNVNVLNTREVSASPHLYSPSGSEIQAFQLVTEVRTPAFTPPPAPADLCVLFSDLYLMDGKPLSLAAIHVRLLDKPMVLAGKGIFDTQRVYTTNQNGHVEFSLVQGLKIEIAIAPLSVRRVITVPSGLEAANPVNFLTLLSSADDVFDIISPVIPAAPRRSL